jgi:ribose 5-phosphate isomerase RpiB
MPIIVASDMHGEFTKEFIKKILIKNGCDVLDIGFISEHNVSKMGTLMQNYPDWTGLIFCKNVSCCSLQLNTLFSNIKCVVAHKDSQDLYLARNLYNANIVCFPNDCGPQIENLISTFICVK